MTSDRPRPAALVTGATTGIGRELARLFARDGYDLALVARSREELEILAVELRETYAVDVVTISQDLSIPGGPQIVFDAVRQAGLTIETLVNNAGFAVYGEFSHTPLDDELGMIALNASAVVALTKLFLLDMLPRKRGRILQVASTAAFLPGPYMAVYYATKALVLSFSEALREELRKTSITISVLCPGPTATGFQKRAGADRSKLFSGLVMDAATVAKAGYEGLGQGKSIIVPGASNKVVPLVRFLPRRVMLWLSRRASEITRRRAPDS